MLPREGHRYLVSQTVVTYSTMNDHVLLVLGFSFSSYVLSTKNRLGTQVGCHMTVTSLLRFWPKGSIFGQITMESTLVTHTMF